MVFSKIACSSCGDREHYWDRIAGKVFCPMCTALLAFGEAGPIVARVGRRRCAACDSLGTLRYLTFPLHSSLPVAIDPCGEHLRALLARRLGPHAFACLRRQLGTLGLDVKDIFLLHNAFYDSFGQALHPALA